jgi:hypothetical protein
MTRHVLTIDLRDDPAAIATYREHHRRVWPEVIESLRRVGVEQMDIHLLGRRLVMIVEMRDGPGADLCACRVHAGPRAGVVVGPRTAGAPDQQQPGLRAWSELLFHDASPLRELQTRFRRDGICRDALRTTMEHGKPGHTHRIVW